MLLADERNFHCWNYRSWVINAQLDQYDEIEKTQKILEKKEEIKENKEEKNTTKEDEIVKEGEDIKEEEVSIESPQKEEPKKFISSEMKLTKLKQEFEMTSSMIEKNFSNFSAWHYRSKLMLKIHCSNPSQYKVPLSLINSELDKIKHAIFTEPNDQSPWNYHRWLVSLLIPTYITSIEILNNHIKVDFSDVIFDSNLLKCIVKGKEYQLESSTQKYEGRLGYRYGKYYFLFDLKVV